jgi:hypothetical protein
LEEVVSGTDLAPSAGSEEEWISVLKARCFYHRVFGIAPERTDASAPDSPFGSYMSMSSDELRAKADAGEDGLAQYVYADRLLGVALVPGEGDIAPERVLAQVQSPDDELFETVKRYFVEAIRNRNWVAARRLALMYYPFDKVEARAWLVIEEDAGGGSLDTGRYDALDSSPALKEMLETLDALTDEEKDKSELRAEELIEEFDLTTGLLPLEECRDIER